MSGIQAKTVLNVAQNFSTLRKKALNINLNRILDKDAI